MNNFGNNLVVFVGSYSSEDGSNDGGITCFEVSQDGKDISQLSRTSNPGAAGYLVFSKNHQTLYSVNECKTDGRGPVGDPASVYAFSVNPENAKLTHVNSQVSPGPMPTFLCINEAKGLLASANHGSFEHVEKVKKTENGDWYVEYIYDDSTVVIYSLCSDGSIDSIRDVEVLDGHGKDPNNSPQAGGHGQSSAHAHCAVFDPSGKFVIVCDKGTDKVFVYSIDNELSLVFTFQFPPETGPRHLDFDPVTGRAFMTLEFSSEIASFDFNNNTGELILLDKKSTVSYDFEKLNEPAEIRVHPNGKFVYVNNRGEDSVAWFSINTEGEMLRIDHVPLSKSIHPGLAARSFTFEPSGGFLLVADRPANLMRSYSVNPKNGTLTQIAEAKIHAPAFITFADIAVLDNGVK